MLDSSFSPDPSPYLKKEQTKRGRPRKYTLLDYVVESKNIKGLKIGDDIFLCFNQLIESVLKHIPSNTIHEACFILNVKYKQFNNSINKLMKTANAIRPEETECNLIKIKDAERLCNFLLQRDTSRWFPSLMAYAFHDYFGGCEGIYIFKMDVDPRSRCIECNQCSLLLSAQRFLCHSHVLEIEKRDLSSDPLNWDEFIFIRRNDKTYSLSFFRKWMRETFSENSTDLSDSSNEHPHSIPEQSSPTDNLDVILNDSLDFLCNVNRVSSASTNSTSTKQKSRGRTSKKPRRSTNIKSSEMLQSVFSPELTQLISVEDSFDHPDIKLSPTILKYFDFSTITNKPARLSTSNIEPSVYANTDTETFAFSTTEDKPFYFSAAEAKPLDLSTNKTKPLDYSATKTKSLKFSDTEIKPLDLSTTKNKPNRTIEAAYCLMNLVSH